MTTLTRSASVCALVPHRNCTAWLSGAVQSLLTQTRPPDAVVVVDDASVESPLPVLEQYPEVTFLRAPESVGPYRLVQTIIDLTDFDAYLFQDADDVSHPDRLATLLDVAEANQADIVGSHEIELDVGAPEARWRKYPLDVNAALGHNPISFALLHPTSLVSRDAVARAKGFPGLRFSGDVDFLWRAAHVARIVNADHHLYLRRRHPQSLTGSEETGTRSQGRRQLENALRARARANARLVTAGEPPDLSPYVPAPPVLLEHLSGPELGTRHRRPPSHPDSSLHLPGHAAPVLIVGGPRNGGDVLACALDLHPRFEATPATAPLTGDSGRERRPVLAGPAVTAAALHLADEHPDAKFIVVERDVETTVASLVARPDAHSDFYSGESARAAAVQLGTACALMSATLGTDRITRISLAQLVTDPVASLSACLAFLGEPMVMSACLPLIGLHATAGDRARPDGDARDARRLPAERLQATHQTLAARLRRLVGGLLDDDAVVAVISRGDPSLLDLPPARTCHFPSTDDGSYAGEYPATSHAAIALLEGARARGVSHLLIPAPASWWLTYYGEFRDHLHRRYSVIASAEDTGTLFDLVTRPIRAGTPQMGTPMRIALVGTSDIPNYGDLLHPEIVRTRQKGAAEVVCYSPLTAPSVRRDDRSTFEVDLLTGHHLDAIIFEGGNLVHTKLWSHASKDRIRRLAALAARFDSIAERTGAVVILVVVDPAHGDDVHALRTGGVIRIEPQVGTPPPLIRPVAAAMGHSLLHLGSSLHGTVTLPCFGEPPRMTTSGAAMLRAGDALSRLRATARPRRQLEVSRVAAQKETADTQAPPDTVVAYARRITVRERQQPPRGDRLGRRPTIMRASPRSVAGRPLFRTAQCRELQQVKERAASRTKSFSVAVVCWDLGHNALGRAHLLADMLATEHDVEIVGSHFPEFGSDVWQPLQDTPIRLRRYSGERFPQYFQTMERMAEELTAEVVYVVKPRLPALGVGFLAKSEAARGLALDCDDLELSFVGGSHGLSLGELERCRSHPEFLRPQGRIWTSFAEWAVRFADAVTVSNAPLAARYGGTVIPHARDERVFDPCLYDRDEARARLGLNARDRLILFAGTPRRHKGIQQVAAALDRIGDPRNRLCILATRELKELKPLLAGLDQWVEAIPPQPFSRLPQLLSAADAICTLQDTGSEVSRWQIPARITDALAMGIPCLATPTPPLLPLIDDGALVPVTEDDLAQHLERILTDEAFRTEQARHGRELFLRRFSYAAVRPQLERVLGRAASGGEKAPADLASTVSFLRSTFGQSSRGTVRPEKVQPGIHEQPAVAPKEHKRPRPAPRRSSDDRIDIAMFWRQNDSGLYGRRQDMLAKYLASSPKVRRIVHFDNAISMPALLTHWRDGHGDRYSQSALVFRQTLRRIKGTQPHPKVRAHTFVYQGGDREPGARLRRLVPRRSQYEAYVGDVLAQNGFGRRPIVFWAFPTHRDFPELVRRFRPDLVVSDLVDDTRTWSSEEHKERLTRNYAEILGMSDLVIANCESVKQAMEEFSPDIHVVPNACEPLVRAGRRLRRPCELRHLQGPIIGYVGNLSSRIDIELLERMALSRPHWQLVLIGSTHLNRDVLDLRHLDNVHLLGIRPYRRLQAYLQAFDVGIVPHLNDAMTRVMNPLKVFVYAAANLPVVSTALENIEELHALIRVAKDHEEFIQKVEEALLDHRRPELSPEASSSLLTHSWPRRVAAVLELIDARLPVGDLS